jgi:cell division septum initiation protein DivIVA
LYKLQNIIVDKKFETSDGVGYDPDKVDEFFDEINVYIKEIYDEVESTHKERNELKKTIAELNVENSKLKEDKIHLVKDNEYYKNEGYGSFKYREGVNVVNEQQNKEIAELKKQITELLKIIKNNSDKKN